MKRFTLADYARQYGPVVVRAGDLQPLTLTPRVSYRQRMRKRWRENQRRYRLLKEAAK